MRREKQGNQRRESMIGSQGKLFISCSPHAHVLNFYVSFKGGLKLNIIQLPSKMIGSIQGGTGIETMLQTFLCFNQNHNQIFNVTKNYKIQQSHIHTEA